MGLAQMTNYYNESYQPEQKEETEDLTYTQKIKKKAGDIVK